VRGKATSKEVIATCMQLSKKIGKVGVLVGNCRGFVGNRMFHPYRREAQFLVEEGASVQAVDKALYDFGMAMGPLSVADLAGLDVGWRIRKEYRHLEKPGVRQPLAEDRLCEMGRYGQKTGRGYYIYEKGSRTPTPDPEIEKLIEDKARELGVNRRTISSDEIAERTMYPMVNEGARILEEKIAARPSDIDIVWINGYGFPVGRGGPMFWADLTGLKKIAERLEYWHGKTGKDVFAPSPLLKKLAAEGQTFSSLQTEKR
jgi:3-hydroxyacyl-CoA dehydrogenase